MRRFSGKLRSAVIIGIQGIRARKLRTLLSMISLFLGVLAVVTVQAGADAAERAALGNMELVIGVDGTLQMWVGGSSEANQAAMKSVEGRSDIVLLTDTQAIIGEPNVRPVNEGGSPFDEDWGGYGGYWECDDAGYCYEVKDPAFANPEGAAIELGLTAMSGDVLRFRPFRLVSGEWLDFTDEPSFSPRIVLNTEAAYGFGLYQVPAEMRITGTSKNSTPRIIGVVDDGNNYPRAYTRLDELANWVPLTSDSQSSTPSFGGPMRGPTSSYGFQVLAAPDATASLQILRANLVAAGVPADQLTAESVKAREQVEQQLLILKLIFFSMAGLVLAIGIAGILNVGLATVGERVEEFALRRAVGTPRLLLAGIVLAETLLTGLLTAGAAIGFGAFALRLIAPTLAQYDSRLGDMGFPWQAGVAGVIAGLVAGLLGGLVPAIRAARIPIATVMRA